MIRALALGALAAAAATSLASAASNPPVRDCGDMLDPGMASGANSITAQGKGLSCPSARAVASAVMPNLKCRDKEPLDTCSVRGYRCDVTTAGEELYYVRCANRTQTKFVRFEFGS